MYGVIGLVVGLIVVVIRRIVRIARTRLKPAGILLIDTTDLDGPHLFLEASDILFRVADRKYVVFKVEYRRDISQK